MKITLDQLHVKGLEPHNYFPVAKHPYTLAFQTGNEFLYNNEISKSSRQRHKKTGSWSGIKRLIEKIRENGFSNDHDPVVVVKKGNRLVCTHGRHRICILRYLYGNIEAKFVRDGEEYFLDKVYV